MGFGPSHVPSLFRMPGLRLGPRPFRRFVARQVAALQAVAQASQAGAVAVGSVGPRGGGPVDFQKAKFFRSRKRGWGHLGVPFWGGFGRRNRGGFDPCITWWFLLVYQGYSSISPRRTPRAGARETPNPLSQVMIGLSSGVAMHG